MSFIDRNQTKILVVLFILTLVGLSFIASLG